MSLVIPAGLKSQVEDTKLHYRARAWKIQPITNSQVFYITDHSENLKLFDNQIYKAMGGFESSAVRRESQLRSSNKQSRGIIDIDEISYDNLRFGLLDNARIDEYLVDIRMAFIGPIDHIQYTIKSMSFDGKEWRAEIEGLPANLRSPVGDTWGEMCRVELFSSPDARGGQEGACNLTSDAFKEDNAVTLLFADPLDRYQFRWSATINPFWNFDGRGNDGTIEWIDGDNEGFSSKIKLHVFIGGGVSEIQLQTPTPFVIQLGDSFRALPGCDKRFNGDCVNTFDNGINFQGEPFIPGGDRARRGISVINNK